LGRFESDRRLAGRSGGGRGRGRSGGPSSADGVVRTRCLGGGQEGAAGGRDLLSGDWKKIGVVPVDGPAAGGMLLGLRVLRRLGCRSSGRVRSGLLFDNRIGGCQFIVSVSFWRGGLDGLVCGSKATDSNVAAAAGLYLPSRRRTNLECD